VADSARRPEVRGYGVLGGQARLAVPTMHAKILAQRDGAGIGWLPKARIASLLRRGELVEKQTADPREPNTLYVAWRGDREGRALTWWVEALKVKRLAERLVRGLDRFDA
jgi:DNA-binding transcriptional LysR family regulator